MRCDGQFWCRLCALLHEARRSGRHSVYERLEDWWRGPGACIDPGPAQPWSSWRDADGKFPDLLTTAYHRQWTDRAPANVSRPTASSSAV